MIKIVYQKRKTKEKKVAYFSTEDFEIALSSFFYDYGDMYYKILGMVLVEDFIKTIKEQE